MRNSLGLHLSPILILAVSMSARADDVKKDRVVDETLKGMWRFSEVWIDGEHTKLRFRETTVVRFLKGTSYRGDIVDGKFQRSKDDKSVKYKIDARKMPKQVIFMGYENEKETRPRHQVYVVDGDTLVICFLLAENSVRPPKTCPKEGKKGDGLMVMRYTRVRTKGKKM